MQNNIALTRHLSLLLKVSLISDICQHTQLCFLFPLFPFLHLPVLAAWHNIHNKEQTTRNAHLFMLFYKF